MAGLKEEHLFSIGDGPYLSQLFAEYRLGKSFEPEFVQMNFSKLNSETSSEITRQALLLFVERYLYQRKCCRRSDHSERRVQSARNAATARQQRRLYGVG